MEFNPIDKIDDLMEKYREYNPVIRSKSDEGYNWLDDFSFCIEIPNPVSDDSITIICENDCEFTLCFSQYHSHYSGEDYEYNDMCEQISDILNNKCCSATVFGGNENKWLASTLLNKEQVHLPIRETFGFLFEYEKYAELLNTKGGEVRFVFWDSSLSSIVKI